VRRAQRLLADIRLIHSVPSLPVGLTVQQLPFELLILWCQYLSITLAPKVPEVGLAVALRQLKSLSLFVSLPVEVLGRQYAAVALFGGSLEVAGPRALWSQVVVELVVAGSLGRVGARRAGPDA
jgi:hypothetical protein